jgi:hypothetical protein
VDGEPSPAFTATELGSTVFAVPVDVVAGETRRVELATELGATLVDGWYRLTVSTQPLSEPATGAVTVRATPGVVLGIEVAEGAEATVGGTEVTSSLGTGAVTEVGVRLAP